jgi:phospholipid transport system substrate-binding protein
MVTFFTLLIVVLSSLLSNPSATAQFREPGAEEIRTLLSERDQQIKELLGPEGSDYSERQRDELKEIINGIIDFSAIAKVALEATYDTISVEKRDEFVSLFGDIIRDQSLSKLDIYRAEVVYDSIRVAGEKASVWTTASYKEVRTPVSYQMEKQKSGWMITDMSIDNVSTADSYNRQFQGIIRKRGFDALLTSLRKRAERISEGGN